jgi:hypothetical protein
MMELPTGSRTSSLPRLIVDWVRCVWELFFAIVSPKVDQCQAGFQDPLREHDCFVKAEVKHFNHHDKDKALEWLADR